MSYEHESDYWEEMAMESLYSDFRQDPDTRASFYEELYDEIVQDFTAGRLRSYFTEHPDLVAPAAQALTGLPRYSVFKDRPRPLPSGPPTFARDGAQRGLGWQASLPVGVLSTIGTGNQHRETETAAAKAAR